MCLLPLSPTLTLHLPFGIVISQETPFSSQQCFPKVLASQSRNSILFFKTIFYLFTFRQRGREEERKGEKHQCVVASRAPPTGDHVPLLGIKPATLWFAGQHSMHWATPARARNSILRALRGQAVVAFATPGPPELFRQWYHCTKVSWVRLFHETVWTDFPRLFFISCPPMWVAKVHIYFPNCPAERKRLILSP